MPSTTQAPRTKVSDINPGERYYVSGQWERDKDSAPEHMKMKPGYADSGGQQMNSAITKGKGAGSLVNVPEDTPVIKVL